MKTFRTILSIVLAVLIFTASPGVLVTVHKCLNVQQSELFLFEQNPDCKMESCTPKVVSACCHKPKATAMHDDCCKNEQWLVKIANDYVAQYFQFSVYLPVAKIDTCFDNIQYDQTTLAISKIFVSPPLYDRVIGFCQLVL